MSFHSFDPNQVYEKMEDELRQYVIARDDEQCGICSGAGSEIHHVVYRSRLGKHKASNLILLCNACHGKIHTIKDKYLELLKLRIQSNEKRFRESLI